jgi:hypothetical protein
MSKIELDKPESDVFENSLNTRPEEQLHYSHESFLKKKVVVKINSAGKIPTAPGLFLVEKIDGAEGNQELDVSISTHLLRS